nr:amidase [Ruegeria atlantica]
MQVFAAADRTEANIHAYKHLLRQEARTAASEADQNAPTSPIHGWPFAVKEVFDVTGVPTSGGCPAFENRVPDRDATAVRRLRDAGAILIGTQVSHELTCGADEPPTRNPWNLACYPGGSSAGAGASVAVGSARFALGTDAAGSVRIPAAMTGTVGLKPSAWRVSAAGIFRKATAPSIDNVGIVARDVSDVRAVLQTIAGPDLDDPRTLWQMEDSAPVAKLTELQGCSLAVLGPKTIDLLNEVHELDPEIKSAFDNVCDVYQTLGACIVFVEIPELAEAIPTVVTLFSTELAAAHRASLRERSDAYFPSISDMLRANLNPDRGDLAAAIQTRTRLRRAIDTALHNVEAKFLLTPTTPRVAMKLATFIPAEELGSLIPYTCGFNLTGHPALSLPSGFSSEGLPIGHQIVGPFSRDNEVLDLGDLYQSQTHWHKARP